MKLLRIFLLVFLPVFSKAQVSPLFIEPTKKQADSLRIELEKNINDTLRMAACRELALYYLDTNSDSALYFIQKDLPLTKKLKLKLWEAEALDLFALISNSRGNYVQAIKAYNQSLELVEDTKTEQNIWNMSKFTNSNSPGLARLSMHAAILSDMSITFSETGNFDKELNTIRHCIDIATFINDYTILSLAYSNLGKIHLRNSKIDSALFFYKMGLGFIEKSGYREYQSVNLESIGNIYLIKKQYDSARKNYFAGLESARSQNNLTGEGGIYISLANFYNTTGKYDSALYYGKAGLSAIKQVGRSISFLRAYNSLADTYKNSGSTDSVWTYLRLATQAKDSLLSLEKVRQLQNIGFDEQLRLQELEKERIQTKAKIRTYALLIGLGIFLLIALLLYRNNRQKQRANTVLERTLIELKSTQSQLIQSEKMASLGELTAGIAHEIQNPLNFVNNFSEVSTELLDEMITELDNDNRAEAIAIASDVKQNLEKILHHGKQADGIVKGMLQHSHSSSAVKEPSNINKLTDEYLRLAYHGFRAKDKSFNAVLKTDFDESIGNINIIPQDIGKVLLNLYNNAFYAVSAKAKEHAQSLNMQSAKADAVNEKSSFAKVRADKYEPTISISTKKLDNKIIIRVKDNGNGIPPKVVDKIFQPFFTTKPTGSGTGLGLSLSYDIIKAHSGEIKVKTVGGEGAEFIITLPIS